MDRTKTELLDRIGRLNAGGHPWVKLQRDGALIRREEREFTIQVDDVHGLRLTWFGLAKRQSIRTGLYQITERGVAFLRGALTVPAKILCKDGRVIRESEQRVRLQDVRGVILDKSYWDAYRLIQEPDTR
jgi:hypothetical protein